MARLFATSINLNKNELQNARIQNLGSNPSNGVAGQVYFNNVDDELRIFDGTNWMALGGAIEYGIAEDRPAASKGGLLYATTDTKVLYLDNGTAWIQVGIGPETTDILTNKTLVDPVLKDRVSFTNNSDTETMYIEHSYTGTNRVVSTDDLALRSTGGDIILYPGNDDGGTGRAYVHWGNDATSAGAANEITTAGNTQDISNKRIVDSLYFTDGATITDEGEIVVRPTTHEFEVIAHYGDLNLKTTETNSDVNITSVDKDINLTANGLVKIDAPLNVYGALDTTTIAGATFDSRDGSLTLQDASADSQIHIDGDTKNIELLPNAGSKAFYGSAATAGNEIAKISDLQALSSGLNWKQAVNVQIDSDEATSLGLFVSGTVPSEVITSTLVGGVLQIDGHNISNSDAGYRILVTGTNSTKDGIWVLQSVAELNWTAVRAEDANTFAELIGAAVFVMEGTKYAATSWVQNDHYITDYTGQDWIQFSGQGTYIGSNSIQVDGNQINAIVDTDRGLAIDGDGIYAKTGNGIDFDISGNLVVSAGTGLTVSSGTLEFASGYGVRKLTGPLGDNSATSFTVNHNFGTRHVTVQTFQATSPYAQIEADVEHTDVDNVTIKFATAPTTGEYEFVVIG